MNMMRCRRPSPDRNTRTATRSATVLVALFALVCAVTGTSIAAARQDQPAEPDVPDALDARLTSLSPDDPIQYFLLAEERADIGDRALARRLYVLSAQLDQSRLGRSACLALAELSRQDDEPERARRLEAMAAMFGGPDGLHASASSASHVDSERQWRRAGALVSAMLGFYRTGNGARALKALEQDQQSYALLARYERGIGIVSDVLTYCRNHPRCEQCSNEMVIKDPQWIEQQRDRNVNRPFVQASQDLYIVCPRMQTHTPGLSTEETQHMLEIESALVLGRNASWGARTLLDQGAARPVLEPTSLPSIFDIDVTESVYRDGVWTIP